MTGASGDAVANSQARIRRLQAVVEASLLVNSTLDLEELALWATRIAARYMGPELAESFGKRNTVEGELLLRIHPTHIAAIKNMAD